MAKCNQLTPLPFKGLAEQFHYCTFLIRCDDTQSCSVDLHHTVCLSICLSVCLSFSVSV